VEREYGEAKRFNQKVIPELKISKYQIPVLVKHLTSQPINP
jgi:hypothetical protein